MELQLFLIFIQLLLFISCSECARLIGCYKEISAEARLMVGDFKKFTGTLTPEKCVNHCKGKGFDYAGLQAGSECFCSRERPLFKSSAELSECHSKCDGNKSKTCGGTWRLSVYDINDKRVNYVQANYVGCYADDSKTTRALRGRKAADSNMTTPELCVGYCYRYGYRYSALQNRTQCFCGDEIKGARSSEGDCDMDCAGDKRFLCGGNLRNSIYHTSISDEDNEGTLVGCFVDSMNFRLLSGSRMVLPETNSPRRCFNICLQLGFKFAGLEDRTECFCGNRQPEKDKESPENECLSPCPGGRLRRCGGAGRLLIYSTRRPAVQPTLIPVPGVGNQVAVLTHPGSGPGSQPTTLILQPVAPQQPQYQPQQQYAVQQAQYPNQQPQYPAQQTQYPVQQPQYLAQQPQYPEQHQQYPDQQPQYPVQQQQPQYPAQQPQYQPNEPQYQPQPPQKQPQPPQKQPQLTQYQPEEVRTTFRPPQKQPQEVQYESSPRPLTTTRRPQQTTSRTSGTTRRPFPQSCVRSRTFQTGKTVCKGDILFHEKFMGNNIDSRIWKHEVFMPNAPDYEFVVFDNNPRTSFVRDGVLTIKPKVYDDNFVRRGRLNLERCTRRPHSEECFKEAKTFSILPPVQSARLITKDSFSFKYGKIEVRARLPVGDWITPEIWLEPKNRLYGPSYTSGRMRLATSLGNRDLTFHGEQIGATKLESGILMGVEMSFPNWKIRGRKIIRPKQRGWYDGFHNYTLIWTPENISFLVDGEDREDLLSEDGRKLHEQVGFDRVSTSVWDKGTMLAPFDDEFYISIGLSVGGMREYPDNCISSGHTKPWTNMAVKGLVNFWQDRSNWMPTWDDDLSSLQIDHIIVQAL